jgi:hypothetical protein
MDMVRIAAALALLVAGAAPAAASAPKEAAKADPDRQICKSKPVVGSRLKRIRECATAQEWEDMKLQERVGLMRKQVNGDPANAPVATGGRDSPF